MRGLVTGQYWQLVEGSSKLFPGRSPFLNGVLGLTRHIPILTLAIDTTLHGHTLSTGIDSEALHSFHSNIARPFSYFHHYALSHGTTKRGKPACRSHPPRSTPSSKTIYANAPGSKGAESAEVILLYIIKHLYLILISFCISSKFTDT